MAIGTSHCTGLVFVPLTSRVQGLSVEGTGRLTSSGQECLRRVTRVPRGKPPEILFLQL